MYEGQGLLVHSGWDPYTFDNNIALVYLATPVTFTRIIPILLIKYLLRDLFRLNLKTRNNFYYQTEYIRPVCLAAPNGPSYAGEYATVAGWGATSDGMNTGFCFLSKT
jgi:hypothetical protein